MKLRWANLFVFSLVVLFFVLLVKAGPEIDAFLRMIDRMNPSHTTEEQLYRLFAVGIPGTIILALTKILTRKGR